MKAQGLLPKNQHSSLSVMNEHVDAYLRYALQYPFTTDKIKKKIVRFFKHLLLARSDQFIQETEGKDSGIENKSLDQVRNGFVFKLQDMVVSKDRKGNVR